MRRVWWFLFRSRWVTRNMFHKTPDRSRVVESMLSVLPEKLPHSACFQANHSLFQQKVPHSALGDASRRPQRTNRRVSRQPPLNPMRFLTNCGRFQRKAPHSARFLTCRYYTRCALRHATTMLECSCWQSLAAIQLGWVAKCEFGTSSSGGYYVHLNWVRCGLLLKRVPCVSAESAGKTEV